MKYLLRQKLLIAAVFGLLFAAAAIRAMKPEQRDDPPPAPAPVNHFDDAVAGSGVIEASSENISIGTPLAGVVETVFVQVGNEVKPGDPLFELDTRHLKAELAVQETAVAAADARVATQGAVLADLADQVQRVRKLDKRNVTSEEERARLEFGYRAAVARLREAEAEASRARALVEATLTEIERSTVRAPIAGTVLQVKLRKGEFAPAGIASPALLVLGATQPLYVRADIDEVDAGLVDPASPAYAMPRGQANRQLPLKFVRFEPLIVPKRSLTGDPAERVDTRVLQVIYEVAADEPGIFVGQQVDVFIKKPGQLAMQSVEDPPSSGPPF